MAPRLAHKKSRRGCQRCKARKVKCDEVHPTCGGCTRHNVPCTFDDPFISSNNGHNSTDVHRNGNVSPEDKSASASSQPSAVSPHGPESPYADLEDIDKAFTPDERRRLELRLLHHFMTIVTFTFPSSNEPQFREMWNVDVVRLSFQHDFLHNAILAIASLHILSEPGGRGIFYYAHDEDVRSVARVTNAAMSSLPSEIDYEKAHRIYLNLAVRQQRQAVINLCSQNADAILLSALLLQYQALKLLPSQESKATYAPPLQWLQMTRAIGTIAAAAKPIIPPGSILEFMDKTNDEPDFKNQEGLFKFDHPFHALLDYDSPTEPIEARNTYRLALAYVGRVYQALLDKDPPRVLSRWMLFLPIVIPRHFISLVEQGRPRALAILAHAFAMAKAVDEHWWFRGVADREVNGILSILPPEWQWAMEWPLSMAGMRSTAE